ncbi:MAG: type pantothenate kinase [Abditibacteriota bacterium]|nr:type pantothenate kinase [Abditibacteriota bacterium]
MLLAFDIGNTNIVAGLFDGSQLVAQWRLSTQRERTADELAVFLKVAFEARGFAFSHVRGIIVSSVVPSLTPAVQRLGETYCGCEVLVVTGRTKIGIGNGYDNPGEVGADRLVNGVAAWMKYQTACVIADFGTATTVDAVSRAGVYLGGALAPGIAISTNALFAAAAKLPRVERLELMEPPPSTLGRNTLHSVQAGILYGYAGLVKELVTRCVAELDDAQVTTIATGGLAESIAPLVPQIQHIEPHLTLDGLHLIWQLNHS